MSFECPFRFSTLGNLSHAKGAKGGHEALLHEKFSGYRASAGRFGKRPVVAHINCIFGHVLGRVRVFASPFMLSGSARGGGEQRYSMQC